MEDDNRHTIQYPRSSIGPFLSSHPTKCSTLPLSSTSLGQNVLRAAETGRAKTMGIEAKRVRDNYEAPATRNLEGRKRYPE